MSQTPCGNTQTALSTRSDSDLMEDVVERDQAAFAELMARYKTPLYRFILRYVGSPSDAEELLQDSFVSLYAKAASYDPAWKFSTWMYRIALNKCRDHARKQRLRRFISLDRTKREDSGIAYSLCAVAPSADVEEKVIHRQELHRLETAMRELPHMMRSAVVLHLIEGRTQCECSEILGVSRKSVEMLVYRARKTLKQKLGLEF